MSEYKEIPLKQIIADPNQPRKFFDESALQELTDSIREKGLIQPITVRPAGKNKYMIVVGERRYRASMAIAAAFKNRNTIPAIVRELTDEEALELQIIENLQRKDVHPMEEAVSFLSLIEKDIKVEEIALRVGKSAQYVAQRLKLNDLIAEFQELFFHNRINISLATKIAKFSGEIQEGAYKEIKVPKDWKSRSYTIDSIWYFNNKTQQLSNASFSIKDAKLYPEVGACTSCPHNTATNNLLFPDSKKAECYNPSCFAIKTDLAFKVKIEKLLKDPEIVFVSDGYYPDAKEKAQITILEDMGLKVIRNGDFKKLDSYDLDHPGTWEDYLKEHDYWSGDEDYDESEYQEMINDTKDDYNGELRDYEENAKELALARENGLVKKAFIVTGYEKGKTIDIVINPRKKAIVQATGDNAGEITRINDRERRNQELDREKVYCRTMPILEEKLTTISDPLHPEEWKALAMMLDDVSPSASRYLKNKLDTHDWSGMGIMEKLQETGEYPTIYQAIRIAIYDRLFGMSSIDYAKSGKAAALYSLAKLWIPDQVAIFEQEQKEKAEKRQKNVAKRLAALQAAPDDEEEQVSEDDD